MARHVFDPKESYYSSTEPNVVEHYNRTTHKYKKVQARIQKFNGKKIIGYKKAVSSDGYDHVIITLEIFANAIRFQPRNKKCRASRAKVLSIKRMLNQAPLEAARSHYNRSFHYNVGKIVKPTKKFSRTHFTSECTAGIHFFLTEQEAIDYNL